MNLFPRDRYDTEAIVRGLDSTPIGRDGDEICITFESSDFESGDVTIYFPSCTSDPPATLLELAREVCARIAEFDNLVQQSCEDESQRSEYPAESFALHLAYISIHPEMVELSYYGTYVNNEWGALFEKSPDGRWQKFNF